MANINGTSGADNLIGTAAADVINGLGGIDTMAGLGGNDRYIVDNVGDVVIENANEGIDTVESSVSYTIGANIENLTLTGVGHTNATGNELANTLQGNSGNNILDGGAGADTMRGGSGNDTYRVDNAGDQAIESSNQGTDTVLAVNLNWTLGSNLENLTLVREGGFAGTLVGTGNTGYNVLTGSDGNDQLNGLSGNDTLIGGGGNDTLDGGSGYDNMAGGAGDDSYVVDSSYDFVNEAANGGVDTISSTVSLELGSNVENLILLGTSDLSGEGNDSNNSITGNAGENELIGNGGNDLLSGGADDDVLYGDAGEEDDDDDDDEDDEGSSSSSHSDDDEDDDDEDDEDDDDEDDDGGTADIPVVGGNDTLLGGSGRDELHGGAGDDVLDGGTDYDEMIGGTGNDTYFVDNTRDSVEEEAFEGTDTVNSSINYTLGSNLENLVLTGSATTGTGNSANNQITGNALANTLSGSSGNDTLDGGAGNDNLRGGTGNDVYKVDSAGDVVVENLNEGTDTVETSVSYTLGNNVENLVLTGSGNINGTGNALNNNIQGNDGDNALAGGAGNDSLNGGAGNDSLDGGTGNDAAAGGTGDDTYAVDSVGDVVTEAAGEGTDTVIASIDWTLGANVENLTLGGAAIQGTGNELDNAILGNALANVLNGGAGNDILDGAAGADAMNGGAGDDTYVVDNAGDTAGEGADEGTDTVLASIDYSLGANIENLTLVNGAVQGAGNELDNHITGNALANVLSGGAGNDVLDGGDGADQLIGGTGDDSYVLGAGDVIVEAVGEGSDTVVSSVTASLVGLDNVENLQLIGSDNINGTGNALDNLIQGNAGNNLLSGGDGIDTIEGGAGNDTLEGGVGNDVLAGGLGNDVYRVTAGDVIVEGEGEGIDTIESTFSFDLATTPNVENLSLIINGDMFAYGNDLDNVITANGSRNEILGRGGDDRLVGQGGRDTIDGGMGDDRIQGGGGRDTLTGGEGEDNFVFSNTGNGDSDLITDFNAAEDIITLDRSVFRNVGNGPLSSSMFHAGSGATAVAQDASDRIIFDTSTGILYYDSDGAGGVAQVEFAIVNVVNGTLSDDNFIAAF